MAYRKPSDLDGFINLMPKADMRVKAILAEDLVTYLSDDTNSIVCQDLGMLIDGLIPWLAGSHFKIAQKSLEAFTELIKRLGPDFNAYTATVLPHCIDRLGDSKDTVREKAQLLLHNLMESKVQTPQNLIDKLTTCFKHKNAKVREEFLQTIVNTLNEYGTAQLSLKAYIQPIVNLLGDPTATVRDAAIQTLVEIYKHVGDRLRIDLRKKEVPSMKLAILEQKFDEIRAEGLLLKSALTHNGQDEPDTAAQQRPAAPQRPTRLVKRTVSANLRKPQTLDVPITGGDAGAVTWEVFEASFELVPTLTIFTQRDIDDLFKTINITISDKHMDWEKRVDALKKIRSLLMMNVQGQLSFPAYLKDLSIAFLNILQELRSQVIREACITIAYMCKTIRNKLDQFTIYILQELINLMSNSAKIISSAAVITLKYVIKYTHAPKIVPILTTNLMQSKSKDIRSNISELLILLFEEWQTKTMERSGVLLRDAIKKGIADADNDARKFSRRGYWFFKRHFPDQAEHLYASLDPPAQKALERERDLMGGGTGSGSMNTSLRGSNSSLNSMPGTVIKRRTSTGLRSPATSSARSISTENLTNAKLHRVPSLPRSYNRNRSGIPIAQREHPPRAGLRSISAVDTAAAQRARARAQYSNLARMKVTSGTASLQGQVAQQARAKKIVNTGSATTSQHASPEHRPAIIPRSRAGVSQSQPASRSTSPSSKLREMYGSYSTYKPTGTVPKKASGIPRSLANSRETSPTRVTLSGRKLYNCSPRRLDRPPINSSRPVLAQKILQQSREAETALADAFSPEETDLSSDYSRLSLNRKTSKDESDESEASSVCSERSFDSFRRGNDSYSWNGSRNRLDSFRAPIEDIELIIQFCASTHWAERKDGLIGLTQYLSDGKTLTPNQLQCVLDMFRKMFMDTHTKVYALFLDTVNELILAHSNDLHDWLFILLTRLFNKLGTELLGSMHGKIWKTLQLVHEYFPTDLQMTSVFRILIDAAQTPPIKTKIATLKFLTNLASSYCSGNDFPNQGPAEKAILKLAQLACDQKSAELRAQARVCLIALYNCNTPTMTMIMSFLPKPYQDTARTVIQQHLRRSTSGTESPSSSSPLSCSSPKPLLSPSQGPFSLQNNSSPRSRQSSVENPDTLNSEEVYKSLRKTTAEIQNYSFETKLDRDTNSKDSGISQMGDHVSSTITTTVNSGNNGGHTDLLNFGMNGHTRMDKEESCNGSSKTQSAATTESNTPESTVRLESSMDHMNSHKITTSQRHNILYSEDGEVLFENGLTESKIIKAAIILNHDTNTEAIQETLSDLAACIKYGNCVLPNKNFKLIMKMLLSLLESQIPEVMLSALRALTKIVRSEKMKPFWSNFLELILLKIIDCYKNNKEAARQIDLMLPHVAVILPVNVSINILNPVIATGTYPINLCAVKLLTELADKQGNQLNEIHLDSVMPNLARLTDDTESMVRKAAVFCIVKLYVVMGEEKVKPKLTILNPSKMRLLQVYIDKTKSLKS